MLIVDSYIFNPGGSWQGTITLPFEVDQEKLGEIINVTRGSILYRPEEGEAGASLAVEGGSTVITLEQTTTYCLSGDKLQIQILGDSGGGGGLSSDVTVVNTVANSVPITSASLTSIDSKTPVLVDGKVPVTGTVNTLTGLEIPEHDYISLGYTGDNLTSVVYKTGGSGGTTVATLTLAYTGTNLISVTKS